MWSKIKAVGIIVASLKGWAYILSLIPTIAAFVAGFFESLSWSATIASTAVTLAASLALVYYGLVIWEKTTLYFTGRKEQDRILLALNNLGDGVTELDLPTAAAIWAGTAEPGSIERHVHFRGLKVAVDRRDISPTKMDSIKANIKTTVDLESLKQFWRQRGVIR